MSQLGNLASNKITIKSQFVNKIIESLQTLICPMRPLDLVRQSLTYAVHLVVVTGRWKRKQFFFKVVEP